MGREAGTQRKDRSLRSHEQCLKSKNLAAPPALLWTLAMKSPLSLVQSLWLSVGWVLQGPVLAPPPPQQALALREEALALCEKPVVGMAGPRRGRLNPAEN